jgi:hypothetical protein
MPPERRTPHGSNWETELDSAYQYGLELEQAERAERLREYEESPEQADWDKDEEGDEDK